MKKLSVYLLLATTMLIPNFASAEGMSLMFNYGTLDYQGDYGKIWDSYDDEDLAKKPSGAFGLSWEGDFHENFSLGLEMTYFGTNKMTYPGVAEVKHTILESSIYGRINFINTPFGSSAPSGGQNRFRLYGKLGLGGYVWDLNFKDFGSGDSDYAIATMLGYNYAFGSDIILNDALVIGAEYRFNATFDDFKAKSNKYKEDFEWDAFEVSQFVINVGLRFGGSGSSSGSNWDTTASQDSFDNPSINTDSNVQQVNNSGWGALGDTQQTAVSSSTVETPATGIGAVRKRSAEAMNELDALAAKNAGAKPELDKDKYLATMDKVWKKLENGEFTKNIEIPSMGVLFQIGKSNILPYYSEMLNDFIDLYKETDKKGKILIEGYSSNGGNETTKNPKIAQQRAKAVADYFIKNEIPKENLEVKAYGNSKIAEGIFTGDVGCKGGGCYRRVNISIK